MNYKLQQAYAMSRLINKRWLKALSAGYSTIEPDKIVNELGKAWLAKWRNINRYWPVVSYDLSKYSK